jgi:hypothetical protein
MKNMLSFIIIGIFLISLTSAITYKQNQVIQLTTVCDNCTQVNLTKVIDPNGNFALLGEYLMTKNGTNYNYTFSNTSITGLYFYSICGDLNGIVTCEDTTERTFEITYNGKELYVAQAVLYGSLILLLVLFIIALLIVYSSIPSENKRTDDGRILSISRLKYVRPAILVFSYFMVAFVCYIASNLAFAYLSETLVASVFFFIFRAMMIASPIIIVVWFVTIFFSVFEDKEIKKIMLFQGFNNGKEGGFSR